MSSLHRSRRPGLKLVEVIVLLGIAGAAIGLLLPRAPGPCGSARMSCANNLHIIALALHSYADMHPKGSRAGEQSGQFPAGTIPNPALSPDQRLSWLVELLPYIEEGDLYARIDKSAGWDAAVNQPLVQKSLRTLRCPDWAADTKPAGDWTCYVGVAGVGADAASLPTNDRHAGIFGYDRRTTLADIKDGVSHTLIVLESGRDNGPWAQGGRGTVRGLDPADRPYLGPGRQFGGMHFTGGTLFHRRQSVGCQGVMADGSVKLITDDIALEVLEALVTMAGGEAVADDW